MRTAFLLSLAFLARAAFGMECGALKNVKLEHTTIKTAESIPAGRFKPPYGSIIEKAPAFCRVAGVIEPAQDSYIRFEVWMPETGWNEKFRGVGNGGYAGAIDYRALAGNLDRGYATAATNTGHEGDAEDASWAYKHPEKIVDFGYRAVHETTVNAKALVETFYGHAAQHAYFDSCSNGGREALMEAQRFPEDYDGILAGAPAYDWTHLVIGGVDAAKMMIGTPAGYLSGTKLPAITAAVETACDAADGVKDGVVNDPKRCHFDPSVLRCQGPESRACLTDPQLAMLRRLYDGSRLYPGLVPGGESGPGAWSDWITGPGPGGSYAASYLENYLRYMVFDDPGYNVLTANPDDALALAERKTAKNLNATETDLSRFQARGGKLILYHGWNDSAISPYGTIRYYDGVRTKMGAGTAAKFVSLYMAPGMQHCSGGPGPSGFGQLGIPTAKGAKFGIFDALEQWVEQGKKPGAIVATKYAGDNTTGKVTMTRPLCPYPQTAQFNQSGDPNEASSFTCESTK